MENFQSRLVELKAIEAEEEEKIAKMREERLRRREEIFGARLQELSSQANATQLMVQEMRVEAEQVVLQELKEEDNRRKAEKEAASLSRIAEIEAARLTREEVREVRRRDDDNRRKEEEQRRVQWMERVKAQQEILQKMSSKLTAEKEQRELHDEQTQAKEEKLEWLIKALRAQLHRKKIKAIEAQAGAEEKAERETH